MVNFWSEMMLFTRSPMEMSPTNLLPSLLKAKAHQSVHSIPPGASVFDAVKLMSVKNVGALLVMEGEEVVGIITERDYARKIILMSRSSKETPVREIMTSPVMCVHPTQTSEECILRANSRPQIETLVGD